MFLTNGRKKRSFFVREYNSFRDIVATKPYRLILTATSENRRLDTRASVDLFPFSAGGYVIRPLPFIFFFSFFFFVFLLAAIFSFASFFVWSKVSGGRGHFYPLDWKCLSAIGRRQNLLYSSHPTPLLYAHSDTTAQQ